ncbi:MAG: uroporphyrinogen-III synthase [Pelomonas sp.]|nr:uroporphyrinogen-III synthase [Roseateles sp.]
MTTLIVTRPRAQAADWLARLASLGVAAQSLPLIDIGPGEPGAAAAAWRALGGARLAVFASPNAVAAFFVARPATALWPAGALAACVGPGSAAALAAAGVPAAQIVAPPAEAASFDSEQLWLRLDSLDWRGARVLLLRGGGGREWLAERLREQGAHTTAYTVYRRQAPRLDAAGAALLGAALAAPPDYAWLLSSSEAVAHLINLLPPGATLAAQRALATHSRIADAARAAGFGHVVPTRPEAPAVALALRGQG